MRRSRMSWKLKRRGQNGEGDIRLIREVTNLGCPTCREKFVEMLVGQDSSERSLVTLLDSLSSRSFDASAKMLTITFEGGTKLTLPDTQAPSEPDGTCLGASWSYRQKK